MFIFLVRKVIFKELSSRIQILCVKSSEVRYYLELKAKKIACAKGQKGKGNIYRNNKEMFIHTKYSLQLQIVHHYYSGV